MAAALRWRIGPTLLFVAMLASLLAMALWGRFAPIVRPTGVPDDPGVGAARDVLGGTLPLASRGLVLVSALAGESPVVGADALPLERLAAAHAQLLAARSRHPRDPRLAVALAHLELASGRYETAERAYRAVVDRTPHHGEARLGLGIALALRGDWTQPGGPGDAGRGAVLEALAQFANVDREDPVYWAALYDRALLSWAAGRGREARALLEHARDQHPPGPWAERYRRLLLPRAR